MKILSQEQNNISEYRLSFRGVIVLLLLTAVYFACFCYMPHRIRYLLFAGTAVVFALFLKPKPGSWLPVLPTLFLAGAITVPSGEFNPALSTLMVFGFVFMYMFDRIASNKPLFIPSKPLLFLFIAFLIQVISVFISIHHHGQYAWNAIREGSSIFLFFPLAIIVPCLCRTEAQINRLLRALLLTVLLAAFVGVMQYSSITGFSRVDINLGYLYRGRVASVFGNPNIFAGYLELSLPLTIALFFREKDLKWKLTALTATVLGILSVLFTFSRGGLMGMFLGCGTTLFYVFRKKIWVPIILVLGFILIMMRAAGTFERQMSFFKDPQANMSQPTILHRYVSYKGFLNQFKESPIIGIGWGADEFFWGRSRLYSFWEVRHRVSTETILTFGGLNSVFLNQAVKGGVIALASLLLLFAAIYMAFFRAIRRGGGILAVALVAGIFSFMIHQVLGNQLRFPTVNSQFWFITGLLLVLATSDFIKPSREERLNLQQLPESKKQEDSGQKGRNVLHS